MGRGGRGSGFGCPYWLSVAASCGRGGSACGSVAGRQGDGSAVGEGICGGRGLCAGMLGSTYKRAGDWARMRIFARIFGHRRDG